MNKLRIMENRKKENLCSDYRRFKSELMAQLNALKALERQFYELDDVCEWSLRNSAMCRDESFRLVNVAEFLDGKQREVYLKMCEVVGDLDVFMEAGKKCFIQK